MGKQNKQDKQDSDLVEEPTKKKSTRGKGQGRRKIDIVFINDTEKRRTTFSKRKAGAMRKVYEISTLTGCDSVLLLRSETGHAFLGGSPNVLNRLSTRKGLDVIDFMFSDDKEST